MSDLRAALLLGSGIVTAFAMVVFVLRLTLG